MIKGKHIAITGILAFYKRKDAFDMIRDYGGIPQENVTKESNKRFLAERYISQGRKIRIIKEDEFLQMIWFSP